LVLLNLLKMEIKTNKSKEKIFEKVGKEICNKFLKFINEKSLFRLKN